MKLRQWTIAAATTAALTAGGYRVATWNPDRGYAVVHDTVVVENTIRDTVVVETVVRDTLWFQDSTKLVKFARFGQARFGKGARFAPPSVKRATDSSLR